MSRIGKLPILVPQGVKVALTGDTLKVEGPKGSLAQKINPKVSISISDGRIVFSRSSDDREIRTTQGLMRSLAANMVTGVTQGFEKRLEVTGVGYKAEIQGNDLVMSLGFSHPVRYPLPKGVKAEVDKMTTVILRSADKQLLGQVAAEIRDIKPPEPYKGKGVRYQDEKILRKAGKAGKAGGK